MPNFSLGMNAKLYYGTAGTTAATELTNVRDATLSLSAGEADVTTRANDGWRATAATLKECELTFQMLWDDDDAGFAAIKNAYLNSAEIALLALTKANGSGIDADFTITGFTRNEALEEALSVDVTAKLSTFREWTDGTGS